MSKQTAYMERKLSAGQCRNCGQDRGADGTVTHCRKCADRFNKYHKRWRDRKAEK